MNRKAYSAEISWDAEASVWYVADTDFPGLVAESETQEGLIDKIHRLVPELYAANSHLLDEQPDDDIHIQVTSRQLETIRLAASG